MMVRDVVTVQSDDSAYDAVRLMNRNRIGCLVTTYDGRIYGILTERDLLERVLEKCRNPKETMVSEIMTSGVIVGDPDMHLDEATRLLFENKVKKLPIVKGSQLVGLVTMTDIARATSIDRKTVELFEKLSNIHTI
ncbi:MAG: CBS domain-containing protein [Candidatus Bathyarchaeota archaeon]|nr:MAG: CBS domain-containing protein [Candidatus Bathyarchaeota archaeon]